MPYLVTTHINSRSDVITQWIFMNKNTLCDILQLIFFYFFFLNSGKFFILVIFEYVSAFPVYKQDETIMHFPFYMYMIL